MLCYCPFWKYPQGLEVRVSAMSIQWVMRTFSKLLSHFCDQPWVFGASGVWGPGDSLVWQEDANHAGLPCGIMLTCSDVSDCLVVYDSFGKSYKGLALLAAWQCRRSRNLALRILSVALAQNSTDNARDNGELAGKRDATHWEQK